MTQEEKNQALIELKAQAYDAIANSQLWQEKIKEANEAIKRIAATPVEEKGRIMKKKSI